MHLRLGRRVLVSAADGEDVGVQPHDGDGEENAEPAEDGLAEVQNLRQILRKHNQQEQFWEANFDAFRYPWKAKLVETEPDQ